MPKLKNQKHELFAQYVASGMFQSDAWIKASGKPIKRADVTASSVASRPEVKARILHLQKKVAEHVEAQTIKKFSTISREEVVGILADALRMNSGDARLDSNLTDVEISKCGERIPVMPKRVVLIDKLCKMHGWDQNKLSIEVNEKVVQLAGKFIGDDNE